MPESNQEGYQTLGWIINKSDQGVYLAVAPEALQQEIAGIYKQGNVSIYDYKQYPGAYSFQKLREWVVAAPETHTFLIVNFQLALQEKEDLKRLNFSRDMLTGLEKNLIFLTTPYGDDQLAVHAYDFYSFVKLRVIFHEYEFERKTQETSLAFKGNSPLWEQDREPEEARQQLQETNAFMRRAEEARDSGQYDVSESLLLKAKEIREKLLGAAHIETAEVYIALACIYDLQGRWREAIGLYEKSLPIMEEVLGQEHPHTAMNYSILPACIKSRADTKNQRACIKRH